MRPSLTEGRLLSDRPVVNRNLIDSDAKLFKRFTCTVVTYFSNPMEYLVRVLIQGIHAAAIDQTVHRTTCD